MPAGVHHPLTGRPGGPRVSSRTWAQAGKVCVRPEGCCALAPKGSSCAAGGAGTRGAGSGERTTDSAPALWRRGRSPGERGPLAGCVRMRVRSRPSEPAAHLHAIRQFSSFPCFHPAWAPFPFTPQVGHRRGAHDSPCPAHLGLCTWPSPGPTYIRTCSYLHKERLEDHT